MKRKSPLSEKQWDDIGKRLLAGEKGRVLAREYGISETAIRKRFGSQVRTEKTVANQLFEAENAFRELPIGSQIRVANLLDELRAVSIHLAGTAKLGAMTAHRLAGIANQQVDKLDDIDPLNQESMETLKGVAVLTELSNKAAQTGLNLLAANKKHTEKINEAEIRTPTKTLDDFYADLESSAS